MTAIQIAGIPWYRREQYERVRREMTDGGKLHASFDDWLRAAEQTEQQLKRRGITTVRAHIDMDQFVAWCRERGLNVDASGRNTYANTVAAASYQQGSG